MRDTLIRVDEETWINPSEVAAIQEETYSNSHLIRIHLRRSDRVVTVSGTRAAELAVLLTTVEELR